MSFASLLNTTMRVEKITTTQGDLNQPVRAVSSQHENVPCRRYQRSGSELLQMRGREAPVSFDRFMCLPGLTITAAHQIRSPHDGAEIYDIVRVNKVAAHGAIHHIEVDAVLRSTDV